MRFIARITAPLTGLLSASTDLGVRVLGMKPSDEPPITEEEIRVLIDQGTEVGVFGEAEQDMVEGIFRLNERSINAIMTPRTEIAWLDAEDKIDDIIKLVLQSPYSRFPVSRGSLDNVLGILNAKTLLEKALAVESFNIVDLLEKPLFIPENTPAMRVLEMEKELGVHEALVIDEYGGVMGFVTLFDVLEAIIGELPSQGGVDEPEIVQREDGSYLLDGLLPVDEFKELFDIDALPEEDKVGFQTVGGFVMNQIGSIPTPGQSFAWESLRIEVLDMDGHRVDKVMVTRKTVAATGADEEESELE
jgi:putative hemolysin